MKIYNKEIIKNLQHAINKNNFTMVTFKDYSFITPPYIQIAELKIQLNVNASTGEREPIIHINNSDITSAYIKEWRQTAPGKFFISDYRNDNKDFIGNTLYHEISYITDNHIKFKALVRLLNEITNYELTEEDKNEYIKLYGDIKIDNKYFSIIKIYPDDGRHNLESGDSKKLLDNPVSYNNEESSIIENKDILQEVKIEDEEEPLNLDPLF